MVRKKTSTQILDSIILQIKNPPREPLAEESDSIADVDDPGTTMVHVETTACPLGRFLPTGTAPSMFVFRAVATDMKSRDLADRTVLRTVLRAASVAEDGRHLAARAVASLHPRSILRDDLRAPPLREERRHDE